MPCGSRRPRARGRTDRAEPYGPRVSTRRQLGCLSTLAAATVVLAGCGGGAVEGTASSGSASSSSAAPPTDAAGLAAALQQGARSIRSAHLSLLVSAAGQTIDGQGDETLSAGKLQDLDLTETVPGAGQIRILMAGGQTYVQLPASVNRSGKPWTLVSTSSSNPVVAQLASTLEQTQQSASLDQYTAFTRAATGLQVVGPEQVGGADATHYKISVDVTRLPETQPGREQLLSAGLTTLPVDLWVDAEGRPVKVTEDLTVQGQTVDTTVTIGNFDAPVTITAPPADQVATG
jgi:hypothetical protein